MKTFNTRDKLYYFIELSVIPRDPLRGSIQRQPRLFCTTLQCVTNSASFSPLHHTLELMRVTILIQILLNNLIRRIIFANTYLRKSGVLCCYGCL